MGEWNADITMTYVVQIQAVAELSVSVEIQRKLQRAARDGPPGAFEVTTKNRSVPNSLKT